MAMIELRVYDAEQGKPRRAPSLLVDGKRVPMKGMGLDIDNPAPPFYDDPDERVRELAKNTSWGRLYRLTVDGEVLFETREQPTRAMLDDGATAWRWADVRLFFEPDPYLRALKGIAHDLFWRYPDARFGPGHVVLEDGNWGAYQEAIGLIHVTLAVRSLTVLGLGGVAYDVCARAETAPYMDIVRRLEFYANHSTAELGATLAALELIRWHKEGHQGDAPKE